MLSHSILNYLMDSWGYTHAVLYMWPLVQDLPRYHKTLHEDYRQGQMKR